MQSLPRSSYKTAVCTCVLIALQPVSGWAAAPDVAYPQSQAAQAAPAVVEQLPEQVTDMPAAVITTDEAPAVNVTPLVEASVIEAPAAVAAPVAVPSAAVPEAVPPAAKQLQGLGADMDMPDAMITTDEAPAVSVAPPVEAAAIEAPAAVAAPVAAPSAAIPDIVPAATEQPPEHGADMPAATLTTGEAPTIDVAPAEAAPAPAAGESENLLEKAKTRVEEMLEPDSSAVPATE